jgi:hypothetical protein
LRQLRLAGPAQLSLGIVERGLTAVERWLMLPTDAQEVVLAVLARMISAGVVITETAEGEQR